MKKQPLRVGFDLDGVLLYNPARIVRPIVVSFKKLFLPNEQSRFHLPKNQLQKLIWLFLHKSSFMIASGYDDIKQLVINKNIEAFIISGRYDSLKGDFNSWLKKIEAKKYFKEIYYNSRDEQPPIYKERMIKKLKLDIFIEDNWDIIKHLNADVQKMNTHCKLFWIYNIFDRKIEYPYKFSSLKKAIEFITQNLA